MKATAQISSAERVGRVVGRIARALNRLDQKVQTWLVARGMASYAAQVLSTAAKLIVISALLYVAFWFAVLGVFVVAAAYAGRHTNFSDVGKTEWRNGPAGYGLYGSNGYRIDAHDPDDENG
ncbi:DUF3742 family protein [Chitinimonas lacunae]|uniref:DUF3742 family protein n=1 Tax=Chitinimonas lacunae TaxID=1963018 RepID=A0ABV8MR76_9NEIS